MLFSGKRINRDFGHADVESWEFTICVPDELIYYTKCIISGVNMVRLLCENKFHVAA